MSIAWMTARKSVKKRQKKYYDQKARKSQFQVELSSSDQQI